MHGGAAGSGAPDGWRNGAYRHGMFTLEEAVERRELRALLAAMRRTALDAD